MTALPFVSRRRLLRLAAVGVVAVPALSIATDASAASAGPSGPDDQTIPNAEARDTHARNTEARNTAVVRRAFAEFYGGGRTERFAEFFDHGYIEHDPAIAAGRSGLLAWVRQTQAQRPRSITSIKRIIAQGSMVAVHSHRSTTPADEMTGTAVIELFSLRAGRIVEHWTYTQAVPATTRSGNSMFSNVYAYPGTPPVVTRTRADANRQLILKAWAAVFSARDLTVLDRYWAPGNGYLQHNPNVPNGVGGLKGFLGTLPPSVSQNRFSVAAGDLVLTVNQSVATSGDLDSDLVGSAVADVYRIVDGRAVEHWDVVSPVPTTSANDHSVFSRLHPEL
ncbi:putative SnoaL-like aldol condensation-catalyzing enzyme [Nakamurella sp. UYEF19]|uniref:nuclear transport factor 2 family protein n=1 Tax=Nakamurella sp. UYEF19 TaxID=1756392 RepID=UPI0033966779